MTYGLLLSLLGISFVALGAKQGGFVWLAGWLGMDFVLLGTARLLGCNRVFGKRNDGSLPGWSLAVFGPYFLLSGTVWRLTRLFSNEKSWNQATPTLTVGRRLYPREATEEFSSYVDLTAEFAEPLAIRSRPGYLAFPILDGAAPSPTALLEAIQGMGKGRVFVHCAQGHGRTGLFAAAVLLDREEACGVDEALEILRRARPGICLNRTQRKCLEAFARLRRG